MRTAMKTGERLRRRFDAEAKLIQRQLEVAEQEHDRFKNCSFNAGGFFGSRLAPQRIPYQLEAALERGLMTQGLPPLGSPVHPLQHVAAALDLPHNLVNGGVIYEPHTNMVMGEDDPPHDLAQKFFFERLTGDASRREHHFVLNSTFPLTTPSGDEWRGTTTIFHYRFTFPVGSPGIYAFLPLAEVVGTLGYATSGGYPGSFSVLVEHSVNSGGQGVGWTQTSYWSEIGDGEVKPVLVNPFQLLLNDASYGPVAVQLDPAGGDATVDVAIVLGFHNGPSSYYMTNPDGHFVLDCESSAGKVSCLLVKWGMQ